MRVALIHDYLTQMGGAERVLGAFHDQYPGAPVFTSIVDRDVLPEAWRTWEIHESPLGLAPRAVRWHRAVPPLYPLLFRSFARRLRDFDVVLSDSSAWSHQAGAASGAVHICYCHSPARFLYGDEAYLRPAYVPALARPLMRGAFRVLRGVDRRAARRVDQYIANSSNVAERIRAAYGREAIVIYPPVDIDRIDTIARDFPDEPEDFYLVVSRLVPHKRVDLAVAACSRLGVPLKVVGEGRSMARLTQEAGGLVEFLGKRTDDEVGRLLARARGLILPAMEDFGITAVEAQAAGRPVIALDAGGARESVIEGETGIRFPETTIESLSTAIQAAEAKSWNRDRIRKNAARFGKERFQAEIAGVVDDVYARKQRRSDGNPI